MIRLLQFGAIITRYNISCYYNIAIAAAKHQWDLNTLRPRQNGRHFPDDIFKSIFVNENVWILIKISLKFVPKVPINNIPALVRIMAWCRPGDKPLSEPMMVKLLTHICVTRPQWVKLTKYTPYFAVMGEIWGVYCENFRENLPHYESITLYQYQASTCCGDANHQGIWRHDIESTIQQYHCHTKW